TFVLRMTATTELIRSYNGVSIPEAGNYELDPTHSSVEFVARHLMISKVRGNFTDVQGAITIADTPEESSVAVTIAAARVNSGVVVGKKIRLELAVEAIRK